jgi:hypothetical protein
MKIERQHRRNAGIKPTQFHTLVIIIDNILVITVTMTVIIKDTMMMATTMMMEIIITMITMALLAMPLKAHMM